jgi:hypothetical protein
VLDDGSDLQHRMDSNLRPGSGLVNLDHVARSSENHAQGLGVGAAEYTCGVCPWSRWPNKESIPRLGFHRSHEKQQVGVAALTRVAGAVVAPVPADARRQFCVSIYLKGCGKGRDTAIIAVAD